MRTAIVPTLLAIAALPLSAADWIRVEPQIGFAKLSGDVTYSDNGIAGTQTDMSSLGLGSTETMPGIEIDLSPPLIPFGFNVGGYSFSTSGSGALSKTINFGGINYTSGTTVSSEAKLQDVYGEINFQPVKFDLAGASIGLAVHQMSATVSLKAPSLVATEADKTFYFPAITARAYVHPIDAIKIEGAVQYCGLTVGDASVSYINAHAQVGYFPVSMLGVFAGYRHILLDVEVEPSSGAMLDANVTLSGPFVGIEACF